MKSKLLTTAALASVAWFTSSSLLSAAESAASFEEIVQSAQAANKPILLEFTGSDWCPPCKMMQKEVFSTEQFKIFAESDIIFVKLDFPRQTELDAATKARNQELQKKFGIRGYPTLVVLDSGGKELAREVGFMRGGPDAVIDWIKKSAKL